MLLKLEDEYVTDIFRPTKERKCLVFYKAVSNIKLASRLVIGYISRQITAEQLFKINLCTVFLLSCN